MLAVDVNVVKFLELLTPFARSAVVFSPRSVDVVVDRRRRESPARARDGESSSGLDGGN